MRLNQIIRNVVFRLVGVNLFNYVSLDFSMKPLPRHKVLSIFSPARDFCIPRVFSPYPLKVHIPTRHTFEVWDITIAGLDGISFSNGVMLAETSSWPPEVALTNSPLIRTGGKTLPGRYVVIGNASYYHFLIENFGQALALIEEFPDARVLVPEKLEGFAKDAIGLLPNSTEVVSYRTRVQPESVLLASRFLTLGRPQPREVRALQGLAASTIGDSQSTLEVSKKIYVSRRFASRSPRGERELEQFLERVGFKTVFAEHLSLRDQIVTFNSASVIVGPHGAGLSNIVFGKPGATVIELLDERWPNHCFEILAAECSLEFHRITLTGEATTGDWIIERVRDLLRDLGQLDPLQEAQNSP